MDNASTLGANLARVDGYATAADQDELRRYLEAHFDGEQHLVNEALSAARRVWHERRAAG
jgi:hypothetical protein